MRNIRLLALTVISTSLLSINSTISCCHYGNFASQVKIWKVKEIWLDYSVKGKVAQIEPLPNLDPLDFSKAIRDAASNSFVSDTI